MSTMSSFSNTDASSGSGAARLPAGSALGKRPADSHDGPDGRDDAVEQVCGAMPLVHAHAPQHMHTHTHVGSTPRRTGAVRLGAER